MVTFAKFKTNQKMHMEAARRLMHICIVYTIEETRNQKV